MHNLDMTVVEMSLDIMKYVINRITQVHPELGVPKKEEELLALVGETVTPDGIGGEKALQLFRDVLAKATVPVDHPRHLAFVPASPTRSAVLFDLITSASSIHGAYWMEGAGGIFCENQAMKWLVSIAGMPEGAFGVFTSGGTAANLSAIVTAREAWRRKKAANEQQKGLILTSSGAHSSLKAMARVVDCDMICIDTEEALTAEQVEEALQHLTPNQRQRLFCIVATGGTTNAGIIDDLAGIAPICQRENLWFHVDAAYGGGALAAPSVRHLFQGIEEADSITIDPHKWLFSPYDCGAILYRNPELARMAHAQQGSYLDIFKEEGAHGFNPAEYQVQLTRRVRGLPLWFSLAMHGTRRYSKAIERGLELAQLAASMIELTEYVELVRPPGLSCVLFRRIGWTPEDYVNWTYQNHKEGIALVTPTKWTQNGQVETVSRFCFINPDTTEADIQLILDTMQNKP